MEPMEPGVRVQAYGNGWISGGFGGSLKPTPPEVAKPDHLSEIESRNS